MTVTNHDTLVRRLALILVKLNQGEKLDPKKLAEEFNVNLRTVQRDINERFSYLPLEKVDGQYRLDATFLGKLTFQDIERFAALAGVSGLFPSLSFDFLREIFDSRIQSALLVKGHSYENLSGKEEAFKLLEKAIISCQKVGFSYGTSKVSKAHVVEPYKLINNKGIWYLAAKDQGKLKTFTFSKIESVAVGRTGFTHDPELDRTLVRDEGVWLTEEPLQVVLKVDKAVAPYFERRKVIANQVIEKVHTDGGLTVSVKVGHEKQILPIVRYWIPNIRIVSPAGLQAELECELRTYLSAQ